MPPTGLRTKGFRLRPGHARSRPCRPPPLVPIEILKENAPEPRIGEVGRRMSPARPGIRPGSVIRYVQLAQLSHGRLTDCTLGTCDQAVHRQQRHGYCAKERESHSCLRRSGVVCVHLSGGRARPDHVLPDRSRSGCDTCHNYKYPLMERQQGVCYSGGRSGEAVVGAGAGPVGGSRRHGRCTGGGRISRVFSTVWSLDRARWSPTRSRQRNR